MTQKHCFPSQLESSHIASVLSEGGLRCGAVYHPLYFLLSRHSGQCSANSVLGHVPGHALRHVLKHVLVRYLPKPILGHIFQQVLRCVPRRYVLEHITVNVFKLVPASRGLSCACARAWTFASKQALWTIPILKKICVKVCYLESFSVFCLWLRPCYI